MGCEETKITKKEETCQDNTPETPKTDVNKASIKMIEESEATGKVKEIYEEIKKALGIDFVPNMYKAIANNLSYLEITWKKIQDIMSKSGKLDNKTKDVPGVAESVVMLPGGGHKFLIDEDKVPNNAMYNMGYVHFHPAAEQVPGNPGIEGYFLKHTAVTSGFEFPAGRLVEQQGIDFGFPNNYELI